MGTLFVSEFLRQEEEMQDAQQTTCYRSNKETPRNDLSVQTPLSWMTPGGSILTLEAYVRKYTSPMFHYISSGLSYLHPKTSACESAGFSIMHRLSNIRRQNTFRRLDNMKERDTLEARYAVEWRKPIGEGSFGSVYVGEDRKTGESVAIKKISKQVHDSETFQREMDALMHIRSHGGHPNICGLRANYDQGDYYYLVLDLVSGGEMFDHLCNHGAYSEADAARLIREVASALSFIHGLNCVHGDLKPENCEYYGFWLPQEFVDSDQNSHLKFSLP